MKAINRGNCNAYALIAQNVPIMRLVNRIYLLILQVKKNCHPDKIDDSHQNTLELHKIN